MTTEETIIHLDCIATDPNLTTLYGIFRGIIEGENFVTLVKSTTNPDHLGERIWSVVSSSLSDPLGYGNQRDKPFKTVDCAVNSKGVFVAFLRNGQVLTPGSVVTVRYDPATQVWSRIRTSPHYGWSSNLWKHKSFYVSKEGVESAVHLLTGNVATVIRFGVLGGVNNVLRLAGVWKWDNDLKKYLTGGVSDELSWETLDLTDPYSYIGLFKDGLTSYTSLVAYANGHLYIRSWTRDTAIASFPLADFVVPPPSIPQSISGFENFHEYFFAGTRGNSTYLGGIGEYNSTSKIYEIYTMNEVDGAMKMGSMYTILMRPNPTSMTTSGNTLYSSTTTLLPSAVIYRANSPLSSV
ncbi:hypothetical protein BGX23_010569 [Mortierella sp. AD031]|nr:hypothetical protein BGX23_010569 [Mortierella sp. AD031]